MLNKIEHKKAVYYCSRYFCWLIIFTLLTAVIVGIADFVLANFKVPYLPERVSDSLTRGLAVGLDIYFHQVILNKIFLKKYKYIVITPMFKNITKPFIIKTYFALLLASTLIALTIFAAYFLAFPDIFSPKPGNRPDIDMVLLMIFLNHWTLLPVALLLTGIAKYILLKRIVSKNAEVMLQSQAL